MKAKLFATLLVCIIITSAILPVFAVDTLLASDFQKESWAKTIDMFDYARAYALLHGMTEPPNSWHAYLYTTYVNTEGLQMLYGGLCNITFDELNYLTIPMQTVLTHFKTQNNSRDVIMASTFLMLMAFNDTEESAYSDSPDMYDNLWSSFSIGFNFASKFPNTTFPSLHNTATIIPLTSSNDKKEWSWGMKYTNLTAIWWRTYISPTNHTYQSWPMALTTYDELTFTYNLTIDPETNKATLTENYVIGRIRDLWHFWGWFIIPFYNHYNSTGCYRWGQKISDVTVYDFLQEQKIKMSIVNFQKSVMLDRNTYSTTPTGENVTDSDIPMSDSSISTYSDDGEKIFDTSFGTKETYNLYNYTADPTESAYDTYNATTRTCKIDGFAQNLQLFAYHVGFMKFLPLLVVNMHSELYQKAKETITNMTQANYFYLIAYPTYSGYRVVHDPTIALYLTTSTAPVLPQIVLILLIAAVVTGAIVISVLALKLRKKPSQPAQPTLPPQ